MSTADKFKETVKYISVVSEKDDPFGKVKLCKLLFRIDTQAYLKFGKTVTGQEYKKLPQGPVPTAIFSLLDARQDVLLVNRDYCGYPQQRPVATNEADVSVFTAEEIALIDAEIRRCWGRTATDLSNESHLEVGWILADDNAVIPIETALLDNRALTAAEIDYASTIDLSEMDRLIV